MNVTTNPAIGNDRRANDPRRPPHGGSPRAVQESGKNREEGARMTEKEVLSEKEREVKSRKRDAAKEEGREDLLRIDYQNDEIGDGERGGRRRSFVAVY